MPAFFVDELMGRNSFRRRIMKNIENISGELPSIAARKDSLTNESIDYISYIS